MILIVGAVSITLLVLRILWRISNAPSRKYVVSIFDAIFDIPAFFKIGPWSVPADIHTAIVAGIKKTKLSDFGGSVKSSFIKLYDMNRHIGLKKSGGKFSPAGHLMIGLSMERRIEARLNFVSYLKKHPSVEKTKLKPPIFVIGLTRTGTTFLHELLGLNENFRSHYTWEQMDPVPKTDDENLDAQAVDRVKRYDSNKGSFNLLFKHLIHEKIQHIHRIAYDETEECTIPCSFELPWALVDLPLMIFACEEVIPMGAGDAFDLYKKLLQLLTWQSKDRRDQDFTWMLKCPFHLPYLPELFQSFPGATVVWTHRDPAECIASACSLFETIMQMGMEESSVNPILVGKAVMNYSKLILQKAEQALINLPPGIKVVHLRYKDTIQEPKNSCKKVIAEVSHLLCIMRVYNENYCFYRLG